MTESVSGGRVEDHLARLVSLQPRTVWRWLNEPSIGPYRTVSGSVLSADISGFTRLAERLSELGSRQAAEALNDTINRCFEPMIEDVVSRGGDVLKFGGDAIFALFEGARSGPQAAMAAAAMQRHLASVDIGNRRVLSMTVGVASGPVALALAGTKRRELIVHGSIVDECLQLESDAEPGEVLISPATAAQLPGEWYREPEPGIVSLVDLDGDEIPPPDPDEGTPSVDGPIDVGRCSQVLGERLASAVDAYAGSDGEIRVVTVAFVFVPCRSEDSATPLGVVERAIELADRYGVTLLGNDVSRGGIKLLLTAGAPLAGDGDEDAMLSTISELVLDPRSPAMRAGVNRGLVYAGFLGSLTCRTFTVMGDPTNLAARLLGKAEDRSVAVSQAVLDRARNVYETRKLAPALVKGRLEPVIVHRLGRLHSETDDRRRRPGFVGRQNELAILRAAVEAGRQGEGSVLDLVGEGGIGVSRLVDEFVATVPAGVLSFDMSGGVAGQARPYHAVRSFFRALAGMADDLDPDQAGSQLATCIQRLAPELTQWIPLIAPAFDVEADETEATKSVAVEFRRERTNKTLVALAARALTVPTVLVIKDAHWIDPASREVVRALAAVSADHPWIVIATGRPGTEPIGAPEATLTIGRLAPADVLAIIEEVGDLPADHSDEVARRSGGNPLFAIELAVAPNDDEQLFDSIEGLVTARIDRMGHEARGLLRTAAVLGERFDISLLDEVVGEPTTDQLDGLGQLVTDDGDGWASFRSAVIRDVAYEGLSQRHRRALHAGVAEALEHREADVASLARHHGMAHNHLPCWVYSRRSADRAIRMGMVEDGFEHLTRALNAADAAIAEADTYTDAETESEAALGSEPGSPPVEIIDRNQITEVLIDLFDIGVAAKHYKEALAAGERALTRMGNRPARTRLLVRLAMTAAETEGSYAAQTERLSEQLRLCDPGPADAGVRAWIGGTLAALLYRADRWSEALAIAISSIEDATAAGETESLPQAMLIQQSVLADRTAPERFEVGLALIDAATAAGDQRILSTAHNNLGLDYKAIGDWDRALEHYDIAADVADQIGDGYRAMFPAMNRGDLLLDRGLLAEARVILDEGRRVAQHYDSRFMAAIGQMELGRLEVNAGRPGASRPLLVTALDWFTDAGIKSMIYEVRLDLLAADLADGRSDEVVAGAEQLDPHPEVPTELVGRLETILGYAHMQQGRPSDALVHIEKALSETEGTNLAGHALALVARSEAEQFLGQGRASRRTRAEADGILSDLGVVALPIIPLPK